MPASNEQTDRSCEHIASLSKSQLSLEIKDECAVCFHNLDGGVKSQVSNLIEACENHVNSKENPGQVPGEGQPVSKITELGNTCLSSNHTRKLKSSKYTLFFSLFHKHRHPTRISPSEKSVEIMESPEKSIQNKNTESILDKIRMASLASVASSMNMPTHNKVSDVSGQRQQRRTGRRNDKFLSLWQDKTTEVRKWNLILF